MKTFAKGVALNVPCKSCGRVIPNSKTIGKKLPRFCSKKCARLFKTMKEYRKVKSRVDNRKALLQRKAMLEVLLKLI